MPVNPDPQLVVIKAERWIICRWEDLSGRLFTTACYSSHRFNHAALQSPTNTQNQRKTSRPFHPNQPETRLASVSAFVCAGRGKHHLEGGSCC